MLPTPKATILVLKILIPNEFKDRFVDWQTRLNMEIAAFPGFVSLEILSPAPSEERWIISQRFISIERVKAWQSSKKYTELLSELQTMLQNYEGAIQEAGIEVSSIQNKITEVFVTEVNPENIAAYQEWMARIHRVEAKFPGFRGVYVQSPDTHQSKNWITFLQFDTVENMDHWMNSPERKKVLDESSTLIAALENHRVISPYSGWFSSIANKGEMPAVWKQTMLVLLVLFPIVMFELKYLSPILANWNWNSSLSTFIGNAISVTLIAWPMMPIALNFLGWWLSPTGNKLQKTVAGTIIVILLYIIEIGLFWHFF